MILLTIAIPSDYYYFLQQLMIVSYCSSKAYVSSHIQCAYIPVSITINGKLLHYQHLAIQFLRCAKRLPSHKRSLMFFSECSSLIFTILDLLKDSY